MNLKRQAALMLAVMLAGCAGTPQQVPGKSHAGASAAAEAFESPEQEATYHVFMGELALQRGAVEEAAHQYAEAAETSTDPSLLQRAVAIAYQAGDNELARQLDQRWLSLAPNDRDALRFAAVLDARLGHFADAARHFEQLFQGEHADSYHAVAALLGQETDAAHGLPVMQQLVADAPQSADAHYASAELALHYDRATLAEQEARQALAIKPRLEGPQLLLARALADQGKYDDALAIIRPRLKPGLEGIPLRLAYAALLAQADRDAEASQQFNAVLKLQPANAQALYSLGLLELSAQRYQAAHDYFRRLYDSGQEGDTAAYFLGNTAELQGHYPDALNWYRQVTEGARWFPAQVAIVRVLLAGKLPDAALKYMDEIVKRDPADAARLRAAEAQLFADSGDTQTARTLLDNALVALPGNDDLLYERALIEESTGDVTASERDLKQIIRQSPDNAEALNALGYTLTIHTTRYSEALGYIQKALELTPEDPAILDSMGWVQFRMGRNDAALTYLHDAYQRDHDPQIAAHLIQVLLAAGRHEEARALWTAALKANPDSADLKALTSKVTP
ncbi:MAG TPA: tetratricopeptide repeat protein [Gammaproteobacteria bacterium]|nr:tetratricopeptide repeat protein [Gammaproteobacteria bacterium]